jgi:hypothetical protein
VVITDGPIILGLAAGALALDNIVELADIEGDESAARTTFDIAPAQDRFGLVLLASVTPVTRLGSN